MNKINIGLIGYGNVGNGVIKLLQKKKSYIKDTCHCEFVLKAICDRSIKGKKTDGLGKILLTTNFNDILNNPEIDVVIELIGGLRPAREIVLGALKKGKHVITANKELIAHEGKSLFQAAHEADRNIYFESSVMAGVPVIKTVTESLAGNQFNGLYGIINGTCNYILSEMARKKCTFEEALKEAQAQGFAESDPTLDINGADSAHKLAILVSLTLGKFIQFKDIHTEGITHISHDDIKHAESLGLTIKLLAIAKRIGNEIEVRVHPTLFSKEHPLASINGIYNALFIDTNPLGDILLSGEGAGQLAAASGVISDLINLASREGCAASRMLGNLHTEVSSVTIKRIDEVSTRFYLRIMAIDKPGVLAKITGILGEHGISINSVTQKAHNRAVTIPVIMLTDYVEEKGLRMALEQIHKLPVVKTKPVAIRMEKLP